MRAGIGLRIIGSRHSGDATRLREFAARNRLLHVWIELEEDPVPMPARGLGRSTMIMPVVVWHG
jgi:thioredoxin reductase (NADPH)